MLHAVRYNQKTSLGLFSRLGLDALAHILYFKPRFGYKCFFAAHSLFLLLLPLVITFFASIAILFTPR
jgi:hypothetical protein